MKERFANRGPKIGERDFGEGANLYWQDVRRE